MEGIVHEYVIVVHTGYVCGQGERFHGRVQTKNQHSIGQLKPQTSHSYQTRYFFIKIGTFSVGPIIFFGFQEVSIPRTVILSGLNARIIARIIPEDKDDPGLSRGSLA